MDTEEQQRELLKKIIWELGNYKGRYNIAGSAALILRYEVNLQRNVTDIDIVVAHRDLPVFYQLFESLNYGAGESRGSGSSGGTFLVPGYKTNIDLLYHDDETELGNGIWHPFCSIIAIKTKLARLGLAKHIHDLDTINAQFLRR